MKELVEYIVKSLVSKPEEVVVTEEVNGGFINISLKVDPSDMGLIIGKGGQMIKSIRRLLSIKAMGENVRVNLTLLEESK